MIYQKILSIQTRGRGSTDITDQIRIVIKDSKVVTGLCHIFIHHTSASLMICENADPTVRRDLDAFMLRLVPDGDPLFQHVDEGVDDMPAHVRTILTQTDLTIPVVAGRCGLGTWQGVFLWEHRIQGYSRKVTVTCFGDSETG